MDGLGAIGGCGAAGASAAGTPFAAGRVRNLAVRPGALGTVTVAFAWDGEIDPAANVWWLVRDGEAIARIAPDLATETDALQPGLADVEVYQVPADPGGPPAVIADLLGRRVALSWAAAAAADVVRYDILWDEGDALGAVDHLLLSVEDVELLPTSQTPSTGAGTLAVEGLWLANAINSNVTVQVIAGGLWEMLAPGGTERGPIIAGQRQPTASGPVLVFDSPPTVYTVGAEWSIHVRIRASAITPAFAPGQTVRLAVRAVDAAGNAGAPSAAVTVTVSPVPDPVEATARWDGDANEVVIEWSTTPAGATVVELFTNWDAAARQWLPYVYEQKPVASVNAEVGVIFFSVDPPVAGEFLGYARARASASGADEKNAMLLRVTVPAGPEAAIGAPSIIATRQAAGGEVAADFAAASADLDAADALNVYTSPTSDWGDAVLDHQIPIASLTSTTGVYTITTTGGPTGPTWVGLRFVVVDESDEENPVDVLGPRSNLSGSITPDRAPPAQVTGLTAEVT